MAREKKSARFIFSAEPSLLQKIDKWRAKQNGLPSRAEAVRRLIIKALGTGGAK
jgi:metal-responsive CopG/Arc/MetJ family transcriptional regulator